MADSGTDTASPVTPVPPLRSDRAFCLFAAARTVSWTGTGISAVVLPVLVYQRTGSAALTGLLAAAEALPYLLFGLLAGAVADRARRRLMMAGCDLGCALLMASIPAAWAAGALTVAQVIAVAFGAATLFVWFDAASFGAVPMLAGPARVVRAVAGLSAASAVTAAVAPALAGGLLAVVTPAQAVILDAASYLVSAALIIAVRRPMEPPRDGAGAKDPGASGSGASRPASIRSSIAEGLAFLWRHPMLRTMTLAVAAMSVAGGGVYGLIVVYANRALGLARTGAGIGLLFSAVALGSAAAAAVLLRLRRRIRPGPLMLISLAAAAVTLAAVAVAPQFGTALAALTCFGLAYSMVTLGGITLRQEVTPPALQSRVNTTGRTLAWGTYPVGAALGGVLAEVLPVRVTLLALAVPVIAAVLLGLRSALYRQEAGPPEQPRLN